MTQCNIFITFVAMKGRYTEAEKINVIKYVRGGKSVLKASREFNVSRNTISKWLADKTLSAIARDNKGEVMVPRKETPKSILTNDDIVDYLALAIESLKGDLIKMKTPDKINFAKLLKDLANDQFFGKNKKKMSAFDKLLANYPSQLEQAKA